MNDTHGPAGLPLLATPASRPPRPYTDAAARLAAPPTYSQDMWLTGPPPPTPAPTPLPPAVRPMPGEDLEEHWRQVTAVQEAASTLMEESGELGSQLSPADRREAARAHITTLVAAHVQRRQNAGDPRWTREDIRRFEGHVMDALFGLGRLQELVDRQDVENIEVTGSEPVILQLSGGGFEQAAPVAGSDQELLELISTIATQRGSTERPFSSARPFLALALPGGYRLQAAGWVTPRPKVVIRRDRLRDIDLAGLVELGEIDTTLAAFFTAAVRARRSIIVSGQGQGSGKTTLLRALANTMDPWESVAVLETDRELRLDEHPERHHRVISLEARPGSGEFDAFGRPIGEISVESMIIEALRFNIDRIIVGEVRGPEVRAMLKAMQMGNGSLSTIHADSAAEVVERIVTLVAESGATETFGYRQVAQTVDLIVYIAVDVDQRTGRKRRYVTEVLEVGPGEAASGRPVALSQVFAPHPVHRRAVPHTAPESINELRPFGFHPELMGQTEGAWTPEVLP